MKNQYQKCKLLRISEILRKETDEEHPMSTLQLMEWLMDEGIKCERKSVYDDVRILRELGYPIVVKRTRVNEYYWDDRSFSSAELRLLIDSVKAKEMTMKIAALAGNARGERIAGSTHFLQSGKRKDDLATGNIEILEQALERRRKVRFRYFHLLVDKSRDYRINRSGTEWYEVSPKALVCNDDNYYLVCIMPSGDQYYTYRVDRMSDLTVCKYKVDVPEWSRRQTVGQYLKGSFSMYSGERMRVTLLCRNESYVIDIVYDKFGYDTVLHDRGDGYFFFSTEVQLSPVFYSWLMSVSGDVWLYAPREVSDRYREALQNALADVSLTNR